MINIPKGPDKEIEQEVLNLLHKADQEVIINWKNIINIAQECNEIYMNEVITYIQRTNPDSRLSKVPSEKIKEEVKRNHDQAKKYSLDDFYYPAIFEIEETREEHYPNDWDAHYHLQPLLSPNFKLPDDLFSADTLGHFYVLSLKKVFYLMSKENKPPLGIALKLADILYQIYERLIILREKIKQSEPKHDSHQRGRQVITIRNLSRIRRHRLYPEIEKIMATWQDSNKEKQEIDALIKKILKRSEKVVRGYRESLLGDYEKKNQNIEFIQKR